MAFEEIRYRRQFMAGPGRIPFPDGWREHDAGQGLWLAAHPDLLVTRWAQPGKEAICLGHLLDPADPQASNSAILEHVVSCSNSFEALEEKIADLGGRFALFAFINGRWRLYPDAGGLKSIFYTTRVDGVFAASQPRLLSNSPNAKLEQRFKRHRVQNSWPGGVTPFPGVTQLLPNH